jgi:hypothetical protein
MAFLRPRFAALVCGGGCVKGLEWQIFFNINSRKKATQWVALGAQPGFVQAAAAKAALKLGLGHMIA